MSICRNDASGSTIFNTFQPLGVLTQSAGDQSWSK
jgi:hypothetical protein